jgi:hypothetical protein
MGMSICQTTAISFATEKYFSSPFWREWLLASSIYPSFIFNRSVKKAG